MKVINLTMQHTLSSTQLEAGLYNPQLNEEETNNLKRLGIVDPESTEEELITQAKELLKLINLICKRENVYNVHLMGQFELVYYVINESNWDPIINIKFYVSTTKRVSKEIKNPDESITKTQTFEFVKLRRIKAVFE